MAPRSPTHAFDPTPALEHNPDNYTPLNHIRDMSTSGDSSDTFSKGVHFSDPPSMPTKGRHSIATTTVPLLPSVPSASHIPQHGFQMTNSNPEVDITAYMDQCRLWNTQLRESHESERRAWDIERTALKSRIAELEKKLNKGRDPKKRRSSNDSSSTSMHSFRLDYQPFGTHGNQRPQRASEPTIAEPPVWKGPESTPPVTRVFSHEDDISHLPSISEDDALPSLSKEVSPTSGGQDRTENVSVPIEQVDNTLDGITLKSAALTSSFDTKITSPQFTSPNRSPSPQPKKPADVFQLNVKTLLSPLDEKLKRHAGHTPMAFDGTLSSDAGSTNPATPKQEKPFAPAPTKRPPLRPSENSDSYFSFTSAADGSSTENSKEGREEDQDAVVELDGDRALRGPLMLDPSAQTIAANSFLSQVDAKLSEEVAHREKSEVNFSNGNHEKSSGQSQDSSAQEGDDGMPRLKIKNSMNFGSAWGGDMPGHI